MSYFTRVVKETLANSPIGGWLGQVPFVEAAYRHHALSRPERSGFFCGIYESYQEALAHVPRSRLAGWDNEESAALWINKIHEFDPYLDQPSSYATFFWLSRLMREGTTLIDFGGSIGVTYYRFLRCANLPAKARWTVVEVPKIAAEGRRVAAREAAVGLEFETAIDASSECDILLAAGALQTMEQSVPGLLEMRAAKPPHIILNKVPLASGEAYWTLLNFGPAVSPYRVYNEKEFIGYFENAGYTLMDRWAVAELECYVPFHPDKVVQEFAGFYFKMSA